MNRSGKVVVATTMAVNHWWRWLSGDGHHGGAMALVFEVLRMQGWCGGHEIDVAVMIVVH